jgi:hypothetical protein
LAGFVQSGVELEFESFLTYMLFREQKRAVPGWSTFQELRRKVPERIRGIQDYFDMSAGTVRAIHSGQNAADPAMTEAAGVGASLGLADKIFGTHHADWERIAIGRKPGMDFQLAAHGGGYIQVESKGAIVDDVTKLAELSNHKGDILRKKVDLRQQAPGAKSKLIGMIAAYPNVVGPRATIRLLDPPAYAVDIPADKYKTLARMSYYGRLARAIGDSRFVTALLNRIADLLSLREWDSLSSMALINNGGEPFYWDGPITPGRAHLSEYDAVARMYVLGGDQVFLDGVNLGALRVVAQQDFSKIRAFAVTAESRRLRCVGYVHENDIKEPLRIQSLARMPGFGMVRVRAECDVTLLPSGQVVGFGKLI